MAIEVFNRHENKYLLNSDTYEILTKKLRDYMELDEYNKTHPFYTISNLYFDTHDNYLIRTSLAKPKYKEKLRLRAYGVPSLEDKVYLEIKKKVNGMVNKRRTKLVLEEAYQFVNTGEKPEIKKYMNQQVLKELEYFLKFYELSPKLYLAYDRQAYFAIENRDLRLTFDTNIRTRREDLRLEAGDHGDKLLDDGIWLMEVKAEKCIPVWLVKILSEYKLYKTSFSKYGTEYKSMIKKQLEMRGNECLIHY
jgi:SPX domain protein involved in polyphosphate accumulation